MGNNGPYLFDVSALTIAFAGTPVSEGALDYVRNAVKGEIHAIVPRAAMIGAYHVLRKRYNFPRKDARNIVTNLLDAGHIEWCSVISEAHLRKGLETAHLESIDGWDGYYAELAREKEATVLTLDGDFEELDGIGVNVLLDEAEFRDLTEYMTNEGLINPEH